MEPLIYPNLHVALVHYPIALLIAGTLIEFFSFMWRKHSFRAAGRWMILLGALCAIPTLTSGLYALRDVASMGTPYADNAPTAWREITLVSPLSAAQWEVLKDHLLLNSFATGLAVFAVIVWIGCSDRWRNRLHFPILILILISVGLVIAGAWHGGKTVYRQGTAVQVRRDTAPPTTRATTAPTTGGITTTHGALELATWIAPPIQMHSIMAGVVVALGLMALGLSIRKITQGQPVTQVNYIAEALVGPPTSSSERDDEPILTPIFDPQDPSFMTVPAGRFWLLTFLLALLTAGGGYVILAMGAHTWSANDLWTDIVRENMRNNHLRQIAHVIGGSSIIVLSLILAMLARWAPGHKWILAFFALLLLGAIAFQVWMGIALLFDGRTGSLYRFN